jgi:hypothetical protein
MGARPADAARRAPLAKRVGSPISARVRAPVLGPNPPSVTRTCPRGCSRNRVSICLPSAARSVCNRSRSMIRPAMTCPQVSSPGSVTVCAASASDTALVTLSANRGERAAIVARITTSRAVRKAVGVESRRGGRAPRPDRGVTRSRAREQGGDAHEGIAATVHRPVRVVGQVDVATVEDPQLGEELVGDVEPGQLVGVATSELSQHLGVAWIGLGCAGVELGCSAHLQPGHIRDRHATLAGDSH